jgi:hypothetical protein
MAINIPIITEFSDAGLKSARGAFDQFKTKIGEADGAMGKLKAGSGVAFDTIKANAGAMAIGAGAAIAGFAYKAINDFQNLALEVDKFRNTTGLTLDQSSEWVSYTGDLGIQAESMVKIFNRLGKAATDQLPAFKELGVEIAFGPDGAADLEATFLRVNDAINSLDDPVAQAKYRADLFGRGWMDAAELINMSSDEITTALSGVKDFEVIDEKEIQKAKDLRAAQDELGDALARLSVTLGEALIPAFTQATEAAKPFLDVLMPIVTALGEGADANSSYAEQVSKNNVQMRTGITLASKIFGWFGIGKDKTEDLTESQIDLLAAWEHGTRAMINAYEAAQDLGEELVTVDDALMELKGNVDERREWDNLITAIDDAKEAAIDAFFEATPEALRESQRETDDARLKLAEYIAEMDNIPDEKKTEIIAALDQANLAEIETIFNQLARTRNVDFRPTVGGIPVGPGETPSEVLGRTRMATLSSVNPMSGNVTVNVAGSVISQNDLVESVRKGLVNSQRNGAGLVYSNQ